MPELTREYLETKEKEFREMGEKLQRDAIANLGAADALKLVLHDTQPGDELEIEAND